jgi:aryl-alcohol dehydrogenase-like predicted oxidoreductase
VPLEESLGVMADAQRAGKVRHIGVSNFSVKELARARKVAKIVSVQNRYSLDDRNEEDVLAHCEKLGIAFLPWYPLGAGSAVRASKIKRVAKRLGAAPAQIAIAWLLAKSPVMLPIPGTSSLAHLEENMAAAKIQLSREDLAELG